MTTLCIVRETEEQFYLQGLDAPQLNDVLELAEVEYVVLKVVKHTIKQKHNHIYTIFSATVILEKVNI